MARKKKNLRRSRRRGSTRSYPHAQVQGIIKINRRGFAFVTTPEGDYFIPAKRLGGAMDGDTVVVNPGRAIEGSKRRNGTVARVVMRTHDSVIGSYEVNGSLGVVIPWDPRVTFDIFTRAEDAPFAHDGDMVSVRITAYPSRHGSAEGAIEEVIGSANDADIAEKVLVKRYGLEEEFSPGAKAQAQGCALDVDAALAQPGRRDLRDRLVFTIDPVDARDLDDAISIEEAPDGTVMLGVHIADVSHYVPMNSSIDLDARRRSTSIYLVDRVIPMLPEELSNGLCSLNPGQDRLAFTVDIKLSKAGDVLGTSFFPSVIKSSWRLDYDSVQKMLDGDEPCPSEALKTALSALDRLAHKRRDKREARGSIDFDSVEPKLDLDSEGKVMGIRLRKRTDATSSIEEAMILANEAVASHMEKLPAPMVYRVHGAPSKDSMAALVPLLSELGYPTDGLVDLDPHAIQRVLSIAATRPEKDLVEMRVLRSLKRAVYSTTNIGHFGLGSDIYCHFTSPIRRYPDLLVHRLLKAALFGFFDADGTYSEKLAKKSPAASLLELSGIREMCEELPWLSEHCSEMERVAADAEYDSVQIKLCEYMQDFIGQSFAGIVTSVSASGLFVTLPTTVKGLVRTVTLGDEYFEYDPDRQTLVGEDTGTLYRVGEAVDIVLEAVSVRDMTIDFVLDKRGRRQKAAGDGAKK